MKITRALTIVFAATLAISASACAGKKKSKKKKQQTSQTATGTETKKGPAPLTEAEKKVQAQALDVMDKVAAAAVAHKDDCEALADAWIKLWDENRELIQQAINIDSDPQKVAEWEASNRDRKDAINEKLRPAMQTCQRNKRIKDLLAKMKPKANGATAKPKTKTE